MSAQMEKQAFEKHLCGGFLYRQIRFKMTFWLYLIDIGLPLFNVHGRGTPSVRFIEHLKHEKPVRPVRQCCLIVPNPFESKCRLYAILCMLMRIQI